MPIFKFLHIPVMFGAVVFDNGGQAVQLTNGAKTSRTGAIGAGVAEWQTQPA